MCERGKTAANQIEQRQRVLTHSRIERLVDLGLGWVGRQGEDLTTDAVSKRHGDQAMLLGESEPPTF